MLVATLSGLPVLPVQAHDKPVAVDAAAKGPPGYDEASSAGVREFDKANYLAARFHFLEAHRIWPTARSLRALGHCEYELRNYTVAVKLLEEALASQERPLSGAQRAESEDLLQRARGYLANCKITTIPADSKVSIDGIAVPRGEQTMVLLPLGLHVVVVQAEGYQTRKREFEVRGAIDQELTVELTAEPPVYAPADARAHIDDPLHKKWWFWTGVGGVAAASLVTALVLTLREPEVREPTGGNSDIVITIPAPPAAAHF